jgi:hypothetical protein
MSVGAIDPFKSSDLMNPAKLGLDNSKADDVLKKLQPFIEHYKKVREQYKGDVYFISVDDNAESLTERFHVDCKRSVDPDRTWRHVGYRFKERDTIEDTTGGWKPFSYPQDDTIDPEATYIITDDMLSSGGTANKRARRLKELGAKRVELWCSHPLAPERHKIEQLDAIDKIVALDTVLHDNSEKMRLEYIDVTADLLAADLYKIHMRLEARRAA